LGVLQTQEDLQGGGAVAGGGVGVGGELEGGFADAGVLGFLLEESEEGGGGVGVPGEFGGLPEGVCEAGVVGVERGEVAEVLEGVVLPDGGLFGVVPGGEEGVGEGGVLGGVAGEFVGEFVAEGGVGGGISKSDE
jgi:hypothetical protein